jgi:hypothetical protein
VHLFARLIEAFQTDQVSLMHGLSVEPSSWRHTTTTEALTGERLSVIDDICRSGDQLRTLSSSVLESRTFVILQGMPHTVIPTGTRLPRTCCAHLRGPQASAAMHPNLTLFLYGCTLQRSQTLPRLINRQNSITS